MVVSCKFDCVIMFDWVRQSNERCSFGYDNQTYDYISRELNNIAIVADYRSLFNISVLLVAIETELY